MSHISENSVQEPDVKYRLLADAVAPAWPSGSSAGAQLAPQLTTQLSSRGQLVIPKALRDAHSWGQGASFVVAEHPLGILLIPQTRQAGKAATLADLIGCAQTSLRLSTQDLTAPVADYGDGITPAIAW